MTVKRGLLITPLAEAGRPAAPILAWIELAGYPRRGADATVKISVIVHKAEEGGYWAEVPAIPGCATQGETMEELLANVREAVEGCLSIPV